MRPQEALFDVEKRIISEDPQVLKDLRQVFDLGIITGYPDGSLHLDKRVSRGEMWAAASRLLRLVEKGSILPDGFVYFDFPVR